MKKIFYGLLIVFVVFLFAGCKNNGVVEKEFDKTLSCLLQSSSNEGLTEYKVYYKDEVAKKAIHKEYVKVPVSEDVPLSVFYQSFTDQYAGINDEHKYEVVITEEGDSLIGWAHVFEFDKLVDYDNIDVTFVLEKDFNIDDYNTILTSHGFTCEVE